MAIIPQLDRLKAQLLTSGLQQKNQPLYQVINQLIDAVRQGVNELSGQITTVTSSGGSSSGSTVISSGGLIPADGEDGIDGLPGIPGPQGLQGPMGPIGPPGIDGECDCCSCFPLVINALYDGQTQLGTYTIMLQG